MGFYQPHCVTYVFYTFQKKTYSNTITELELAIRGKDSKLRKAVLRNQEVEMDVQDCEDKKMDW